MKKLIVANWKMNPATYAEAERLAAAVLKTSKKLKNVETVLCPPFVWLADLSRKHENEIAFGGQDVFWEEKGAYTGGISPKMLKSSGVRYAIIGHSERRRHLEETDAMVHKKVHAALKNGLRAILCVGESLKEHTRGETKQVLRRQLNKGLAGVRALFIAHRALLRNLTVAYEPIWAIGTGMPETPFSANKAAKTIRQELKKLLPDKIAKEIRVLYGGSVTSRNIFGFLVMPEISGALVGGASIDAKEFGKIIAIANLLSYDRLS